MTNFYNNLTRKALLSLFIVFISIAGYCATYYVSNSGSDSNSGLSPDLPWKTLAKVNGRTYMPGDQILFKRGDTWREKLTVSSSGSSSARIIYSNYGTGANPKIVGSNQATTWINQGGNVWKASTLLVRPWDDSTNATANVYFIKPDLSVGTGILKSSTAGLTSQYDWYWSSNAIYVYCATNPGTAYTAVEVAQRDFCVLMAEKNYIEFNGIDALYSTKAGLHDGQNAPTVPQTGVVVRNCETAYHGYPDKGGYGVALTASNSVIEYNKIHDCGRRGTSTHLYGNFIVENVTIQNNTFYHGYHTTSVDLAVVTNYPGSIRNVYIRNNVIEETPTYNPVAKPMTMHIANDGVGSLSNVYIHNNIIKYPHPGLNFRHIQGAFIYNNTFYGHNELELSGSFLFFTNGNTNIKVKNNIFYSQLTNDTNGSGRTFHLSGSQPYTGIESDYNIYCRTNKSFVLIDTDNPYAHFRTQDSTSIRLNYGWEAHSKFVDPKVKSASDLTLQSTSKAINAGVNVGLTKDFNGNPIVGLPDIGAFESGSTSAGTSDATAPIVSAFTIPTTTTSLTVPVIAFTATDNIGVVGYMLTTTSTVPTSGATGWSPTKPTSYVFSSVGSKTLYAWAKDAAGNVSAPRSASTMITIPKASTFTFTGPSSGNVNSPSANFTVTPNNLYTGTVTITFTGTGSTGLATKVLTFSNSSTPQTFTITPNVAGSITLTPSNNGTLSNPASLTYTVNGNVPYLGNKVKGSFPHSIAIDINASQFTASSSFTATTMFISIAPFTGKIKGAIYSDYAGSPGTKLGETLELTNPTIGGFQKLAGLNVPIIQGRKYWLVLWSNALYKIDCEYSGGILKWKSYGTYGSWPSSLNLDRSASLKYSIYVTGGLKSASINETTMVTDNNEVLLDRVKIDVFPNPSVGKVNVRFSSLPDAGGQIDILDISGRKVASRIITENTEVFDLENQPAGLYLVKSILGSDERVQKLIINNK